MKLPTLLPTMALLAFLTFSCSSESIEDDIEQSIEETFIPDVKEIEIEILELINAHRISVDLQPLEALDIIKGVAFGHTDFMIEEGQITHANFFQRQASLERNADAVRVGENLAFAFTNAESVVRAWLNSEGHRENIEDDEYTHFDISAEKDENGRWYYTNIFIRR